MSNDVLKKYFCDKLSQIYNFLIANKDYIDSNEEYKNRVKDRIKTVLLIESFVLSDNGISETIENLSKLDINGLIEMKLNETDFAVRILGDKKDGESSLSVESCKKLSDIIEMFDAEIIDIK